MKLEKISGQFAGANGEKRALKTLLLLKSNRSFDCNAGGGYRGASDYFRKEIAASRFSYDFSLSTSMTKVHAAAKVASLLLSELPADGSADTEVAEKDSVNLINLRRMNL